MNGRCKVGDTMNKKVIIILILFLLLPLPVLASTMDAGEDMISGGLNKWIKSQADSMMSPVGVSMGNLSNNESATPSQRLIYDLDTYELDPYSVGWIKQTALDDYKTYVLVGFLILISLAVLHYLQILNAPLVGEASEFIYGHEKYFDFGAILKTFAKLIFIPIVLPFVLIYSINFEQALSSGIMENALQYISFSSDNLMLYIIQAVAYAFDSLFVFARILLINEICAKVLLIGLFLCVPWNFLKSLGLGVIIYFYTALFMRPVLLLITTMAVQQVAGMSPTDAVLYGSQIYAMSLIFGLIVCIIGVLGPLMYILWRTFIGVYFRRKVRRAF
jgi:hypothetical protein